MQSRPPIRAFYRRALIAAFVLAMGAPLLAANFPPLLSPQAAQDREWYVPGMDSVERCKVGFNHEFGGRDALVSLQAWVRLRLFFASPTDQVILGRDGWLYLGNYHGYDGAQASQRLHPFTAEERHGWLQYFVAHRNALAKRGIPYVVVLAPDKPTIYPEHLPYGFTPQAGPSRLEVLTRDLRSAGVDVVDVVPALMSAKAQRRVYYQTDTHWNMAGGLAVYPCVLQHLKGLFPQLQDLPVQARPNDRLDTDLPAIGLVASSVHEGADNPDFEVGDGVMTQTLTWSRDHTADANHPVPGSYVPFSVLSLEQPRAQMARALVYGDSFLEKGLGRFLAAHFQHSERIWSVSMDLQEVDRLKPEVVVEEMVERRLDMPLPEPFVP